MISLKRNGKLELVEATGLRTRQSSIYKPNQNEDFKISRGKFSDFLTWPRCFYLDRVKGIVSPDMPGWTLNETTCLWDPPIPRPTDGKLYRWDETLYQSDNTKGWIESKEQT